MLFNKCMVVVPGIILAFVLYTLSQGLNNIIGIELLGYAKSPISTAMIAILIGILLGNIFQMRENFLLGIDFTQKYILKLGIICLGIQLKPFEFLKFGTIAIPLIIVCIISVLIAVKLLIKKFKISTRMAYLISIGSTVCGTTAIMATAPIIKANKSEVAYAIANITVFGIVSMLVYPYFANIYFDGDPLFVGLFLGTAIHETSQVAAAGLIYDQQFNSPETLNIATVTKLIRNTFLLIMIPLFAYLYNRNKIQTKSYSLLNIFPYFVLGFIGMIVFRNIGDQIFLTENLQPFWQSSISNIKDLAKIFLSMAMAAIGLSTNLKDIKSMGYKPFIVGFVAMITVGLVSIIAMQSFTKLFLS
ncbi:putative sulfate exporter family transporter [Candidatus Pelagibacter sp.]|nr:putative sulfate exporter family transporter [Candidatus Pelagibacter sp.]